VHLAHVGMIQLAELQVDDDQTAQAAVEEQQVDARNCAACGLALISLLVLDNAPPDFK